jgi:hypothetical protein
VPDWVPANSKIHIDFLGGSPQGRAYVDGVGVVAIETLLGNDPIVENYAPTEYLNSDLTVNGYLPSGGVVLFTAFLGAARSLITAGATFRYKLSNTTLLSRSTTLFAMSSADGNDALECVFGVLGLGVSSWNGSLSVGTSGTVSTVGAMNIVALTVIDMRFEAAINGNPEIIAAVLSGDDRPAANPLEGVSFSFREAGVAIQSISLYDSLPTTDGLVELSAN